MFSVARTAIRGAARPAVRIARRGYAETASVDKLRLTLALPHQSIYNQKEVTQVNIPSTAGELGILANHVPTIQQLKPGVVEVIETNGETKSYFISGGFATVQPDSELSVNSIEAFQAEDFSPEAIKSLTAEAQKNAQSADEAVAAEAEIELEVLEALAHFAK
uniref:ATP synthase subunit delta, mitochondrial n=1 Tax=Yarrowia lipolytica (strain CLIB 122 / E 150) TaxID=284591 RepID=ATPD_YARLI|nr:RecName: Full=ATP synthase subunit delta, mitochondrial; AltName: Full=F-ATPase delta subunit; Flags: Precursor [Yarrowia lipolytica CLIB122]